MKKITTLFALLLMFAAGAWAQESYSVSIDKTLRSTHTSRYTDKVGFTNGTVISFPGAVGDLIFRDLTEGQQLMVKAGDNLTPLIGYRGWAMYGYLYIDYNNDGDFSDDGETVSQMTSNSWASGSTADKTIPAFTITSTPGTYRARYKVEWNNSDPHNINASIAENGGCIIDVMIKVVTEEEYAAASEAFNKMSEWAFVIQNGQGLVKDGSMYVSNAPETVAAENSSYANLLDNNYSTKFHSAWSYSVTGAHYLQANLSEAVYDFHFYFKKRQDNNNNRPTNITIQGSNDGETFTDITTISSGFPTDASVIDYISDKISSTTAYDKIRFVVNSTSTGTVFFTFSEFWMLPSNETTDAAIAMMKSKTSMADLTAEDIEQINQIDEDLRSTVAKVTYVVNDVEGNELFRSTEQDVAKGSTITTLPAEFQHPLFYDYNEISETVTGNKEVEFTATLKEEPLFKFTADATSPVWYFLTLSATPNYVTYTAGGAQNVTLPTTNADNETTHWAFIGDPYAGFTIVNEAAGTSLVLGSDVTTGSSGNGQNVYATLATEGSQTNEVWTVISSSYRTNGFFLQNTEGHRLNKRNGTANVSYWTTGSDAGSTFVATKVPGLAELIPEAETLLSDLTAGANDVQIGYPTASALEAFQQAINDAKTATDEAAALAALKAAMADVKKVENTNYTPRTDVYYTITSGRGSMIYDPSHSDSKDTVYGNEFLWYTTSLDKTNANHQWGFIEVDGKYYMYNVGKRQFANVTQGGSYQGSNGDKHTWMFSNSPSSVTLDAGEGNWVVAPNVRVRATSEVTGKQYAMSISTSYVGPVIAYDDVNDGGIPMTFAIATTEQDSEVTTAIEALLNDPTPYKEALQEAINEANTFLTNLANYPIGDGLNQYTMTGNTDAISSAVAAGGTELEKADATKESLQAAIQAINDAKESISLSLNMPEANTFLRIKSVAQDSYVSSKTDSSVGSPYNTFYTTGAAADDVTTIWFYDGTHLLNYATGLYTEGPKAAGYDASASGGDEIAFSEATNGTGMYWIKPTSSNYWYGGTPTIDRWSTPATALQTRFQLEYVTELPVTMSDGLDGKYYATFSAPVAISAITGAIAHKVKVEGEKAKYSETGVEGIPANTGVLLINETGDDATLTIGDFTDAIDTDLQSIIAAQNSHDGLFFGLSTEDKLGFFLLMEPTESEDPTTGGFKAYLDATASTSEGAKGVLLVEDNEPTGIDQVESGQLTVDSDAVYNLQGQRVTKAQKGVFIQNGKKVVVK